MQDEQLLQDLEAQRWPGDSPVETLRQHGIITYSALFSLLRDETADPELRSMACHALSRLERYIDRRRAIPPLLSALKSPNAKVCSAAAHTLGSLDSRRAVMPLLDIAGDKQRPELLRVDALYGLSMIDDQRIAPVLQRIMHDEGDSLVVRSQSLEWTTYQDSKRLLADCITFLSHTSADMRFWAAYRLSQLYYDISPALTALDRIVAFDDAVPTYWGWHVGREAMYPLEQIYWDLLMGTADDEEGERHWGGGMWLISPAPEYATFIEQCRRMQPDWSYSLTLPPPPTLRVDPLWLADKLREAWPDVALNVRQPRPQAYLLDWKLTVEGQTLIGGLHRDMYAVVITGEGNSEFHFAAWYRGIISPEQSLFLYHWADDGKPLRPGMTSAEVEKAVR